MSLSFEKSFVYTRYFEEYGLKILLKIHPVTYGFYSHWILLQ